MREQLLQVSSSHRTQHVSIFFFLMSFRHKHFISFRFSMDFYSFFFLLCLFHFAYVSVASFESQLYLVVQLQQEKKKVPKTFPRCNICHVLYPVNWRFSPLSQNRFAFFSHSFWIGMFARFRLLSLLLFFFLSLSPCCAWRALWKSLHLHENNIISQCHSHTYTCCVVQTTNAQPAQIHPINVWFKSFLSADFRFTWFYYTCAHHSMWFP